MRTYIRRKRVLYTSANCFKTNIVGYQSKTDSEIEIVKGNITSESFPIGEIPLSDPEKAAQFFKENIFDKIVYAGNGDSLIIEIHIPLYKAEALQTALKLFKVINKLQLPKKIDLVCYTDDMVGLIEPDHKITSPSKNQTKELSEFKAQMLKQGVTPHIILFQNSNPSGLSLKLTNNTLAEIITTYATLCVEHYTTIFPIAFNYEDVLGMGFMHLSLNKYQVVEYLVHKILLGSMDDVEVNQNDVEINTAWEIASSVLRNKTKLLSSIYKIIAEKVGKDKDTLKYQNELEKSIAEIIDQLMKVFKDNKSITLKAAILAVLLNKPECELFSNIVFNNELININDLYNESIDYFVNNNTDNFYQIDNEPIVNPIAELKSVTTKLINAQSQAKFYLSQLSDLEKNIESAAKVEECYVEDGQFVFHGQHFRLLPNVEQEPLAETYEAHENLPDSVDLKQYFNSIKNQGQQGSCLAHAVTSIFEYAMKRNAQKEVDLSEAFLYYNARKLDKNDDVSTQEDTGSRYKPAMDSLAQYGIALERLCPYNDEVYSQEPSAEAYADAATRKLLVAKNVKRTINDVKSALTDGYPVAGSFRLMSSFFKVTDGYIPMPTEEEIKEDNAENKHSHHAMVIVGYSDALRMFVVRNSWGTDWGDGGYCYLPYEYIENETLCDFCCIITEIENLALPKLVVVPSLKVDDSELKIRYLMAAAALKQELGDVEQYKKQRETLLKYLEEEKKLLSEPNKKKDFITMTEQKTQGEIAELVKDKTEKDTELKDLETAFKKDKIKFWILFAAVILGCVLLFWGTNHLIHYIQGLMENTSTWRLPFWSLLVMIGAACGVFGVKAHKMYAGWKEKRDDINRDIDRLEATLIDKGLYVEKFPIRTDSAWALIHALERNEARMDKMYTKIISLINNLRVWYVESKQFIESAHQAEEDHIPFISLFDYKTLDTFYETLRNNGAAFGIDYLEDIENHIIDSDYLKQYKDSLFSKLIDKVLMLPTIKDFNMSMHVANQGNQMLCANITKELIGNLYTMSNVFLHFNSYERGMITPSCNVFAPSVTKYQNQMSYIFNSFDAMFGESLLNFDIVIVKSVSVKFNECVILS